MIFTKNCQRIYIGGIYKTYLKFIWIKNCEILDTISSNFDQLISMCQNFTVILMLEMGIVILTFNDV